MVCRLNLVHRAIPSSPWGPWRTRELGDRASRGQSLPWNLGLQGPLDMVVGGRGVSKSHSSCSHVAHCHFFCGSFSYNHLPCCHHCCNYGSSHCSHWPHHCCCCHCSHWLCCLQSLPPKSAPIVWIWPAAWGAFATPDLTELAR